MKRGGIVPSFQVVQQPGVDFVSLYDLNQSGRIKLEKILAYKNDAVIERYCEDHEVSISEGKKLFAGMLQYLTVCAFVDGAHTPASDIDEMWHIFILHMRDYEKFCKEDAGALIYHDPATDDVGISYYEHTRKCAEALCGKLDESVWPVEHVQYARCISTKFPSPAAFREMRLVPQV
jgi:hypothetical protein